MPGGPEALGFVYFAAAKFLGYTAFCRLAIQPQAIKLQASLSSTLFSSGDADAKPPSAWKAGAIRTLIGVGIGAVVGLGFWKIPYFASHSSTDELLFFSLLVPVRVGEWWLLLRWIYRAFSFTTRQQTALVVSGICASFALDALGIVTAMILPGGFWVC